MISTSARSYNEPAKPTLPGHAAAGSVEAAEILAAWNASWHLWCSTCWPTLDYQHRQHGQPREPDPPAGMLRRAAISTKLIRKHKNSLQLTPAGRKVLADPVAMWFHVAEQLPVERDDGSRIAAVLAMLHKLSNAPITQDSSAAARFRPAEALTAMGWGHSDGTPIGEYEFDWAWDKGRDILAATGMSAYGPGDMTDPHDRAIFLRAALTRPVPDNTASLGPPRPRPRPRRCHTITVRLDGITPTVWRQIRIPSTISLLGLHHAVQAAMGWTCSRLFVIEIGDHKYGYPDPDFDLTIDASTLKLDGATSNVGDRPRYEYDLG